jgi:hypothetical protein
MTHEIYFVKVRLSQTKTQRKITVISLLLARRVHVKSLGYKVVVKKSKSLTDHVYSYFSVFILGFKSVILSVVHDVLLDSETHMVTS